MSEEIQQYKDQLAQIEATILVTSSGPDLESLLKLKSDLLELIALSEDNEINTTEQLDEEYEKFKTEVEESDSDSLTGIKCQAPFKNSWSDQISYHNALIMSAEGTESDLKVKVMFTNPIHSSMLPCPYYLDGECKFDDVKCRFSHGEIVSFESLKDFKGPDYSKLTAGSRILLMQDDKLWYRAIVESIEGDLCNVKLESSSKKQTIHLENVQPLDQSDSEESDNDLDIPSQEEIVYKVLTGPPTSALGSWEQYTKGFGSRIMSKMGYVHGAGLGLKADGIVEPISAVIYPPGKSLDHCMRLKEAAGNDTDLFKAEKKIRRKQIKREKALNRAYEREKQKTDMFTVLNERLNEEKPSTSNSAIHVQNDLKSESQQDLNVSSLKLAEDVRKTEKEIRELNDRLARHKNEKSPVASAIKEKLDVAKNKLSQLQASESKVFKELQRRKDRKKLTIF